MQTTWAVQPAEWFNFDKDGCVYCADIETAYKIAAQQKGDQMIFRINNNTTPIKWVRVYEGEAAVTVQELSHLK
tara:strand:- start:94 stop:315 length:222 start_codon:yes stop_codon:yes gene_type:complete